MTEESADIRHSSSSNSSNSSRRGDGSVPVSWSKVGALLDPLRYHKPRQQISRIYLTISPLSIKEGGDSLVDTMGRGGGDC